MTSLKDLTKFPTDNFKVLIHIEMDFYSKEISGIDTLLYRNRSELLELTEKTACMTTQNMSPKWHLRDKITYLSCKMSGPQKN